MTLPSAMLEAHREITQRLAGAAEELRGELETRLLSSAGYAALDILDREIVRLGRIGDDWEEAVDRLLEMLREDF